MFIQNQSKSIGKIKIHQKIHQRKKIIKIHQKIHQRKNQRKNSRWIFIKKQKSTNQIHQQIHHKIHHPIHRGETPNPPKAKNKSTKGTQASLAGTGRMWGSPFPREGTRSKPSLVIGLRHNRQIKKTKKITPHVRSGHAVC